MPANVIDSFVYVLGLDSSGFKKGQQEANKSLEGTRREVVGAADSMAKAVGSAARQFALAFLGFQTAVGLTRVVGGLLETSRQLGFLAANTGDSAAELRNYARAMEVATGSSDGFLTTIQKIQEVQFAARTGGKSAWTPILNYLHVNPWASAGVTKDPLTLFNDLRTAFGDKAKQFGRPFANSLGLQLGASQDAMNTLLLDKGKWDALLKQQRGMFQMTPGRTDSAARLMGTWTTLKQHGEDFVSSALVALEPTLQKLATDLEQWMATVDMEKLSTRIGEFITDLGEIADALREITAFIARWLPSSPNFEKVEGAISSDPALKALSSIVDHPIKAMALSRDNHTIGGIADNLGLSGNEKKLSEMIDWLMKVTGKKADQRLDYFDYGKISEALRQKTANDLGVIIKSPAGVRAIGSARGSSAGERSGGSAPANLAGATGSTSSTHSSVTIDSMTIVTAATDAAGIATSMERALARKQLIAQANSGMLA